MSQSLSRRLFLKRAGTGAVSLAAALLTGASAAAISAPHFVGEPALLDGKASMELLGYAPAPGLEGVLVDFSVENLSSHTLAVGTSYLQSRGLTTTEELYALGADMSVLCDGQPVRCGSFAAPLYSENAADASFFTLNLAGGCGALLLCFCETPTDWETLELTYQPNFAHGQSTTFVVCRDSDAVNLGMVPSSPAEIGSVVEL